MPAGVVVGHQRGEVSPSSSGVSPDITTTVPWVAPASARSASRPTRTAWPVPSWVSCTASSASGACSGTCGPTCSRPWPTTATTRSGSTARAAVSTWPIMLRPQTGCSTFMVFDFIRVPLPAASTITAAGP